MDLALVYFVAGLARRFEGRPKGLMKVGPEGETLLEYSIKQALSAGITKIILVVSEETSPLYKEEFGSSYNNIPIIYALQSWDKEKREKPWGTIDALCSAIPYLDSPCIACNGDDLYGKDSFKEMADQLRKTGKDGLVGYKLKNVLSESGGVNRGIVKVDENNAITSIVETFDITKDNLEEKGLLEDDWCNMSLFGFQRETLKVIRERLNELKQQHAGDTKIEFILTSELGSLIKQNKIKMDLYPTSDTWLGLTNPEDEQVVREQLKN